MGCDIHMYVEHKQDGVWKSADIWKPDKYFDSKYETVQKDIVEYEDRFYAGRNYDLFAILANVRNGYGFAGTDTGDGFIPISEPRGLPDDVSELIKDESEDWGPDGHSHSWLTLKELLEYDWGQVTKHRGWVSQPVYTLWLKDGKRGEPRSYSGHVSGPDIEHISVEEMEKKIEEGSKDMTPDIEKIMDTGLDLGAILNKKPGQKTYYCTPEWEETYEESAGSFISKTIPKLRELDPNPENVRICFWFDN